MKNKKGFTLVELLAVICILASLSTFALLSYVRIQNSALQNLYNNKITIIENAAYKYGSQNKDDVFEHPENYDNLPISKLIELGIIESDYENKDALQNPITKNPMSEKITISYNKDTLKIEVQIKNKTH